MQNLLSPLRRVGHVIISFGKGALKGLLPVGWRRNLRKWLRRDSENAAAEALYLQRWKAARRVHLRAGGPAAPPGVNLVGYLRATTGLGEAARSSARALAAAGVACAPVDFERGVLPGMLVDGSFGGTPAAEFPYGANLIHVNPDYLPYVWRAFPGQGLAGRPTIGVWYWELAEFPRRWHNRYGVVDELWAATTFLRDSLGQHSPVPVVRMPPCVEARVDPALRRADFGLPDDCFLFLCAYDTFSVAARKNPGAVIESYRRAFAPTRRDVGLVIKVNNPTGEDARLQVLQSELKSHPNCFIFDEVMAKIRFSSLLGLVDAVASLHRSEGFGLVPAEAMSLGKPVIATGWSGNVDFTLPGNSCPVGYRLVSVGRGAGPYPSGQLWAEPDVEQAAGYMQKLAGDPDYYRQIAAAARAFMAEHYSAGVVGRMMRARLEETGRLQG